MPGVNGPLAAPQAVLAAQGRPETLRRQRESGVIDLARSALARAPLRAPAMLTVPPVYSRLHLFCVRFHLVPPVYYIVPPVSTWFRLVPLPGIPSDFQDRSRPPGICSHLVASRRARPEEARQYVRMCGLITALAQSQCPAPTFSQSQRLASTDHFFSKQFAVQQKGTCSPMTVPRTQARFPTDDQLLKEAKAVLDRVSMPSSPFA